MPGERPEISQGLANKRDPFDGSASSYEKQLESIVSIVIGCCLVNVVW